MRILFDHQTFRNQRYGGISLYISRLIEGINMSQHNSAFLTLGGLNNENLVESKVSSISKVSSLWNIIPRKGRRISNIFSLYSLYSSEYDLFHATYYDSYFLQKAIERKPWTFTYHDMVHERLASRFPILLSSSHKQLVDNKERLTRNAPLLISISETTKSDLVNYYQIDPIKIKVVHHGNPYEHLNRTEFTEKTVDYPYILFVGNRWSYKNFKTFIKAIHGQLIKHSIYLICAGGGPFDGEEKKLLQQLKVEHLVHYQFITNRQLPNLYRHALSFVFPSLYEGFGFPILEAFACECPCVLSNAGALPEVAGKAAIYFDPDDLDSIASAVEKIITSTYTDREELIKRGTNRLEQFSWQKTVNETLAVYKQLTEMVS